MIAAAPQALRALGLAVIVAFAPVVVHAQAPSVPAAGTAPATAAPAQAQAPAVPAGYAIGVNDVLTVSVWREKDLSTEVVVRPDGQITLPLVNDINAQGLTPDQLRSRIAEALSKFIEDPNVTVVVKAINSKRVFITGQVSKPGVYPLLGPATVLQLISMAGGLTEFAKDKEIVITRQEGGRERLYKFNYRDVLKGKQLSQNIELRSGDTVLVP